MKEKDLFYNGRIYVQRVSWFHALPSLIIYTDQDSKKIQTLEFGFLFWQICIYFNELYEENNKN